MKDQTIINHYKNIIENRLFDEYDILGFLIFIRNKVDKSTCNFIYEFCDLIAHRERNQGIIRNNIVNAINNSYELTSKNHIKDYQWIEWKSWVKEWGIVGEQLKINILKDNKTILKEITVCIMSLAQDTKYYDKDVCIGKVETFVDGSNNLCLATTEGREDSLMIGLMKCGPFENLTDDEDTFIKYSLETKRENSKLVLYCNKIKFLEI